MGQDFSGPLLCLPSLPVFPRCKFSAKCLQQYAKHPSTYLPSHNHAIAKFYKILFFLPLAARTKASALYLSPPIFHANFHQQFNEFFPPLLIVYEKIGYSEKKNHQEKF